MNKKASTVHEIVAAKYLQISPAEALATIEIFSKKYQYITMSSNNEKDADFDSQISMRMFLMQWIISEKRRTIKRICSKLFERLVTVTISPVVRSIGFVNFS